MAPVGTLATDRARLNGWTGAGLPATPLFSHNAMASRAGESVAGKPSIELFAQAGVKQSMR